jgi:putative membrane protein
MAEPAAPHRTYSSLPPASANGSLRCPPEPQAPAHTPLQTRLSAMRTLLIAGIAALVVLVIFTIQNVHAANISFLGIHLVLPLAGALLGAAIVGSLLTVAAGPARVARLRQIIRRGLLKARAEEAAPDDRSFSPRGNRPARPESTGLHLSGNRPGTTEPPPTRMRD